MPALGACSPAPPPLWDIQLTIQGNNGNGTRILKATPRVRNVNGYCDKVGYGAWKWCQTRHDDDPAKTACDGVVLGLADTGRYGPSWQYALHMGEQGHPCTGSDPGCTVDPKNQYLVTAQGSGTFYACANPSAPLSTDPDYPGSQCTRCVFSGNTDNSCD